MADKHVRNHEKDEEEAYIPEARPELHDNAESREAATLTRLRQRERAIAVRNNLETVLPFEGRKPIDMNAPER